MINLISDLSIFVRSCVCCVHLLVILLLACPFVHSFIHSFIYFILDRSERGEGEANVDQMLCDDVFGGVCDQSSIVTDCLMITT